MEISRRTFVAGAAGIAALTVAGSELGPALSAAADIAWFHPFPAPGGMLTDGYGPRVPPTAGASSFHEGLDYWFSPGFGAPIYSVASGTVVSAVQSDSGLGNHVEIDHGGGYTSVYGHMQSLAVTLGQTLPASSVVGFMGDTGTASGPHLHIEIRISGVKQDPTPYVHTTRYAGTAPTTPSHQGVPKVNVFAVYQATNVGTFTGTKATYRTTGKIFAWQSFVQETPNGPLYWVEFTGVLESLTAAGFVVIQRNATDLKANEIARFGHVPQVGGPIVYTG